MSTTDPATNPPRLHGPSLGCANFKSQPEDFQVEEILGFEPSGEGEHCLVWIEKRDRNTSDVATDLARKLGVRKRLISHCGLKDKNAITRQWFSLHIPGRESPTAEELESEGVCVLRITRNLRKLHRGSHDGNRFIIRLRECAVSKESVVERWQGIIKRGVPNYFGPQRFGRDGGNVGQAIRFMTGELAVRDRPLRGLLISAARSLIFNACVAERVQNGSWGSPLVGEIFGFADNRSIVVPGKLHGDEAGRVANGSLELTSPLWGEGDLLTEGAVREMEIAVFERYAEIIKGLAQFNLRQERRVIRLKPINPELSWENESTPILKFDLPKGTYATTVLRELVDVQ